MVEDDDRPIYEPNPNHVRIGTFALAIDGYNWDARKERTAYGRSWVVLPILDSAKRNKDQRKRLRPDHWPIIFDYHVSDACERIQAALQPPARLGSREIKRNVLGVKQSDVVRACELAGYVQGETGLENFVILFRARSTRVTDFAGDYLRTETDGLDLQGLIPVPVPKGDHDLAEHVLERAERRFWDVPRERSYLWDELARGDYLTDDERWLLPWNKIVTPSLMNTAYTPFDPTKPVVQPPPAPVAEKPQASDPQLVAALARLAKTMGVGPRPSPSAGGKP